jgi:hypothetical protein
LRSARTMTDAAPPPECPPTSEHVGDSATRDRRSVTSA